MGVAALYKVNVFDIKEGFISIVTQMFVQLQFFNIYHETRRLSRGGVGEKNFVSHFKLFSFMGSF